ncbi:OPT oligopeptide transporter protein-domain-containing protein [Fusarium solani]|uniref:OPT oligopeptide transporter protein-domain-containing protein n=1 Tax=Fusarium solani TaxID=169388 RepID=A0A9P9KAY4_FUSSL|nr:OPT oligopeptide transporter protein-domain-containing protein [Fusarium solani]KAH7250635.1 OPT oligopeptide transporter protein-domain-containing protein [Fusarium solani]
MEKVKASEAVAQSPVDAEKPDSTHDFAVGEIDGEEYYRPFPPHPDLPIETSPLTLRAVLIGWSLGALVNASNVYLGLKLGIANDANMFAAFLGYPISQALIRASVPFLSGAFGPQEHSIIQTIAMATGGLSTLFITSVPAMFQSNFFPDEVSHSYGKLAALTASAGLFGSVMAVPMYKLFILDLARDLQLKFPSALAIATTIREFHLSGNNARNSGVKALLIAFVVCFCYIVGSSYAPGILIHWFITWWFYVWGAKGAIFASNWGWVQIYWSPAMMGYGIIIGLNLALSWMLGYVVLWGVIGPILEAKGIASGIAYDPEEPDLMTYLSLNLQDPINNPSPRYWMLWPSVFVMLCASITDIACQWRSWVRLATLIWVYAAKGGNRVVLLLRGRESETLGRQAGKHVGSPALPDPSTPQQKTKWWEFWPSLTAGALLACLIMTLHYDLNGGIAVFVLLLAVILGLFVVQVIGQASIAPAGPAAYISQLVIGGILRSTTDNTSSATFGCLVAGAIVSQAAMQAGELTTDFKVGYFTGTPPRYQFYGQLLGIIPAIFLSPALYIVFAKAYPCINDLAQAATCGLAAPAAQGYRVIALAITSPQILIPRSSWIFTICVCVFTIGVHIIRHWATKTGRTTLSAWIPNMLMVGIAGILPITGYGVAIAIGGTVGFVWQKRNPASFGRIGFAVAAGMIGGESLAGLLTAVLNIAKVGGTAFYGTTLGCPGGSC